MLMLIPLFDKKARENERWCAYDGLNVLQLSFIAA